MVCIIICFLVSDEKKTNLFIHYINFLWLVCRSSTDGSLFRFRGFPDWFRRNTWLIPSFLLLLLLLIIMLLSFTFSLATYCLTLHCFLFFSTSLHFSPALHQFHSQIPHLLSVPDKQLPIQLTLYISLLTSSSSSLPSVQLWSISNHIFQQESSRPF